MRRLEVNLARRAFVNSRPVMHAAALLWLLAVGLGGSSFWLYRNYFVGSGERSRRLADLDAALTAERTRVSELNGKIISLDLVQQNQTAAYLNYKIAQRTLSWGRLTDRLSALLPADVRLVSMAPDLKGKGGAKEVREILQNPEQEQRAVTVSIRGEARTDEARTLFLKRLFADPAFYNADLRGESSTEGQMLLFDVTARYRPWIAETGLPEVAAPGPGTNSSLPEDAKPAETPEEEK